jgi:hypothetical protein
MTCINMLVLVIVPAAVIFPFVVFGQWPAYPTAGAPPFAGPTFRTAPLPWAAGRLTERFSAGELRGNGDRDDGRRSQGLHQAVALQAEPAFPVSGIF